MAALARTRVRGYSRCWSAPCRRPLATAPPRPASLFSGRDLALALGVGVGISGVWLYYNQQNRERRIAEHDATYGPILTAEERQALHSSGRGVRRPVEGSLGKGKQKALELPMAGADDVIEPATNIAFPSTLAPISLGASLREPLRLVGVGVRTVSFLSVRVYAAGFYADPAALKTIKSLAGWEGDLTKERLLRKATKSPQPDGLSPAQPGGEALFRALLDAPAAFAVRITPSRSTDFQHLRDGFYRSLVARMKLATGGGRLTDDESERVVASLQTLKSFFPTGTSVPKGRSLLLTKTASSSLVVEYDGQTLGELRDPFVARELLLAYFADAAPISEKLKSSVAEGLETLLKPRQVTAGPASLKT